jgi:hypothetical protein
VGSMPEQAENSWKLKGRNCCWIDGQHEHAEAEARGVRQLQLCSPATARFEYTRSLFGAAAINTLINVCEVVNRAILGEEATEAERCCHDLAERCEGCSTALECLSLLLGKTLPARLSWMQERTGAVAQCSNSMPVMPNAVCGCWR